MSQKDFIAQQMTVRHAAAAKQHDRQLQHTCICVTGHLHLALAGEVNRNIGLCLFTQSASYRQSALSYQNAFNMLAPEHVPKHHIAWRAAVR